MKVEMVKQSTGQGTKEKGEEEDKEENKYKLQREQQSKAITMA
jgi:hypothetical protein